MGKAVESIVFCLFVFAFTLILVTYLQIKFRNNSDSLLMPFVALTGSQQIINYDQWRRDVLSENSMSNDTRKFN